MMTVTKIPTKYRRPRVITGKEIWASPEPSDLMTWEICTYVKGMKNFEEGCQQCPRWCKDDDFTRRGKYKKSCRMWAEEACRVVMAVQRKEL